MRNFAKEVCAVLSVDFAIHSNYFVTPFLQEKYGLKVTASKDLLICLTDLIISYMYIPTEPTVTEQCTCSSRKYPHPQQGRLTQFPRERLEGGGG